MFIDIMNTWNIYGIKQSFLYVKIKKKLFTEDQFGAWWSFEKIRSNVIGIT